MPPLGLKPSVPVKGPFKKGKNKKVRLKEAKTPGEEEFRGRLKAPKKGDWSFLPSFCNKAK